jgi:hypothetical protein
LGNVRHCIIGSEIATEATDSDFRKFRQNAADRQLDSLKPVDAAKAREALLGIIEQATERPALKADAHQKRDELQAELAAVVLGFDDSLEGERLRRYELAHGRSVARALDLLQKHRRIASPIDPGLTNGAVAEFDIQQQAHTMTEEKTTNEPTVDCENMTIEPTVDADVGPESPTYVKTQTQNSTNEPTVDCENVTIEPTVDADIGLESPTYVKTQTQNSTNEPTVACENVTNEPTLAVGGENGASVGAFDPGAAVASATVAIASGGPLRAACHDPWFKGVSKPCEGARSVNPDQARGDSQITISWVTENEDCLLFDLGR